MPINKDITTLKLDDLSALRSNDYLAHYGVKGQKWGVRQWQDTSGKLTPAGRIHYGYGDGRKAKSIADGSAGILGKKLSEIDDPHKKKGESDGTLLSGLLLAVGGAAVAALPMMPVSIRFRGAAVAVLGTAMAASSIAGSITAASREKAAKERIEGDEIDEETGLPLKKTELTAEQDAKLVNPGFTNMNTNTKNNCVLASTAFELRRRGFDVVAAKAGVGYKPSEYETWFKGAEFNDSDYIAPVKVVTVPAPTKRHPDRTITTSEQVDCGKILADWITPKLTSQGNGARGYLTVVYSTQMAGHCMSYVVENGKPIIYDAQSGRRYTNISEVLAPTVQVGYARLDNLECDYDAMRKAGVI